MPWLIDGPNAASAGAAGLIAEVSLHTGNPGTTGANEATGGDPAYARQSVTMGAPVNGVSTSDQVIFDVPAGTYTHFGVWDAEENFKGGNPLKNGVGEDTSQVMSSQGEIKFTVSVPVTQPA